MSVKSFKFVSPGVFINEIDNSFIPKSAQAIGPVVIGRSRRGLAMQPVTVQSYADYVEMFGDTVPGAAGGDISRDGNYQSPMYGTYTSKAFLKANVAPLTYVRLLGSQNLNADAAGKNGWITAKDVTDFDNTLPNNGGVFGLFVFDSGSAAANYNNASSAHSPGTGSLLGTGSLAAVFYANEDLGLALSGTLIDGNGTSDMGEGVGVVIGADSSDLFTMTVEAESGTKTSIKFGFNDNSDNFIRERFNTNPQLVNDPDDFYPSQTKYWLGETYEQYLRDNSLIDATNSYFGVLLPLAGTDGTSGSFNMKGVYPRPEAKAGWFIGQDVGATGSFVPANMQKLFRLKGRGHGEWLQENAKVSIEKIRQSTTTVSDYGTFSVVLRNLLDTDNNVEVMERFDNCTLDPSSPNFVARKIGDTYYKWVSAERRLRKYGEYGNKSKFVYVEMNSDVEAGATGHPELLPFGYYGPPKFTNVIDITGSAASGSLDNTFVWMDDGTSVYNSDAGGTILSGALGPCSGTLNFPVHLGRINATDGGLVDPTRASFGFRTTRTATSTRADNSVKQLGRLLYAGLTDDPSSTTIPGVDSYEDIITLNNLVTSSTLGATYTAGSRAGGTAVDSYTTLLNAGYDSFTSPFWGAFDGFDITKPDPLYNAGMGDSSTEIKSYIYNTWKRAIDTMSDPEFVDINMMLAPGLTQGSLTQHMINVCSDRADCLSIIDLPDVYTPAHEKYNSDKADRIGAGATSASNALRDRRIDSSYGCTFYPWVQTRDENTGQLVWIPPSVAMAGVLASSQAKADVWFAPAGFNRGGLTDGAAGIPITNVTERVISKDRDTLYEARINPIASFPSTGIVVFGQKTLQERRSALDRINVRRLVIYLKKQISILASRVLFEQNVQATWNRFRSLIEPFLANVKVQFGITDYRLILDESTTTPDLVDQNILYAKIMVKPARAIEYIAIDFVITSTGASFDD